ncbi:MAG TPA: hypothetical protein VFU82_03665, partial [Gammaproteobacteria bacterium]|nr:hypothetical protein [Gammaproteobacteria bacterium]
MRKYLFLSYFLFSMIFPLIFIITWFMKNNVLPTGDAANYFDTACGIAKVFQQQGCLSGLFSLFLLRGWRPIIFPTLIVPYLILFHGSLMYAYISLGLTVFVLSAIYTYKYFRLLLNYFPSIIATNIVLLLPHIQAMIINLYSESLLYPFMIASIYYMVKSESFSQKYYSAMSCCFFSLSILTRPVEQVFHLLPILAYYVIFFCRENKNNFSKMLFVVIMLMFLSFIFLVNAGALNGFSFFSIKESSFVLGLFFLVALSMHLHKKNNNLKFKYFVLSIYFSILIGVAWYLHFA